MAKGTFVYSAVAPKNAEQKRRVKLRDSGIRYFVILLAILVVFFYEYCFDTPSALEEYIQENYQYEEREQLQDSKFNLLYSVYSFPNVIIPFVGGTLIDKFGARIVFIITSLFCVLGQFVFSIAGLYNMFSLMLVGRVIFGIGGEVLQGSQSTIISNWFKPHELSMALGICISFPKLGSALNSYVTPIIANHFEESENLDDYENVGYPLFIGFLGMVIGLGCSIVLWKIDRQSELRERIIHESALLSASSINKLTKKSISQLTGQDYKKSVKIEYTSIVVDNGQQQQEASQKVQGEHINFKDILKLPGSYWLLITVATLAETLFIPFLDNGNKYYVDVFKGIQGPEDAGIYLVIPYLVGALLVPPLGYVAEKVQKRSYLIILNCFFFFLTYLSMFYIEANSHLRGEQWVRWVPVTLMGISIAMFCAIIIPTLPMLVKPKQLGTAFGLMQVLQNLFLGIFPILIGEIRGSVQNNQLLGFHQQTMLLFLLSCLLLGVSFLLKSIDMTSGSKIDVKDFRKQYIRKVLKDEQTEYD